MTQPGHIDHTGGRLLPTRNSVRAIARPRKVWRSIIVPRERLRADCSCAPTIRGVPHAVIDNPVFLPIRARSEARMSDTVSPFAGILIEDRIRVLVPIAWVHRIVSHELQLSKTVVTIV